MRGAALVLVSLLAGGVAGADGAGVPWRAASPGYAWTFPADHWFHPGYRNEWWYFTGHLQSVDDPERRFGFQLTFFRVALLPGVERDPDAGFAADLLLGHAALTDLEAGEHRFSEVLYRAVPWLAGFNRPGVDAIAWCRGPAGTDAPWALSWNGDGFDLSFRDDAGRFSLELATHPAKPLVLHGSNGYTPKGDGPGSGASLYYSFPRLEAEGTVVRDDERFEVSGLAWMDREFGTTQLRRDQQGWDWFGLQLDDGRDLMLYVMRDAGGAVDFAAGTLVTESGEARPLAAGSFAIEPTGHWHSAASGVTYPAGWEIRIPGEDLRLRVEPEVADQENRSGIVYAPTYWEGAVRVRDAGGDPAGQGYVELTGYGEGNRPAL